MESYIINKLHMTYWSYLEIAKPQPLAIKVTKIPSMMSLEGEQVQNELFSFLSLL